MLSRATDESGAGAVADSASASADGETQCEQRVDNGSFVSALLF